MRHGPPPIPVPPDKSRRAAYRRGRWAEWLSRMLLRLKGYRILESAHRSGAAGAGEIDIIACRGQTLVVVEVKARPTLAEAAEAITPRQRARLVRAGGAFLARHPELNGMTLRFDVMLVAPWSWPLHVVDAWRESAMGP